MAKFGRGPDSTSGESRVSTESIRTLAYQLYCDSGRQDGHAMEHWLEAERRLQSKAKPVLRKAA